MDIGQDNAQRAYCGRTDHMPMYVWRYRTTRKHCHPQHTHKHCHPQYTHILSLAPLTRPLCWRRCPGSERAWAANRSSPACHLCAQAAISMRYRHFILTHSQSPSLAISHTSTLTLQLIPSPRTLTLTPHLTRPHPIGGPNTHILTSAHSTTHPGGLSDPFASPCTV